MITVTKDLDDLNIVKQSQKIISGIDLLNENLDYFSTSKITEIDFDYQMQKERHNVHIEETDFLSSFSQYGSVKDRQNIHYKC